MLGCFWELHKQTFSIMTMGAFVGGRGYTFEVSSSTASTTVASYPFTNPKLVIMGMSLV